MLFLDLMLFWTVSSICDAQGYNLAYQKPTWQTQEKYSSARAVDGLFETSSGGRDQCAMSYKSATDVMWMVDLEDIYSIYQVVIYHKTDGVSFADSTYASRFLGFSIYISNTTEKEDGILCYRDTHHIASTIPANVTALCFMVGRYVIYYNTREGQVSRKLDYSALTQINLCEVVVNGCPLGFHGKDCSKPCPVNCRHCGLISGQCDGLCSPGFDGPSCDQYKRINLALHRRTYQMSTRITEYHSDKLVDGKVLTGHISQGACTSTLDEKVVAMWIVDLKKPRRIERINIFSRTDNLTWDKSNEFSKKLLGFSIIVSNTTDRRDGVICYQDSQYTASTIPDKVEIFCSVIGRFVFYYNERLPGIRYPKDYSKYAYGDLCEIEISGCPVAEFGYESADCTIPCLAMCHKYLENLSFRKPTWQSYTYADFGSSDKAVDGRKSRHYRDGQCTITSQSASNTWWVNLEKKYRIAFITLYLRTDNSTFYFRSIFAKYYLGFAVYVSNTTNRNDGVLCYKDHSYSTRTLPDRVTIWCLQTAQYVIYYNERRRGVVYDSDYSHNVFGDLCEVEVNGCPSPVAEVPECSKPCPSNCETCYPNTGFCTKCKPGFEGSACDVVCDAIGRAGIANDGFYNGSFTDMFTSEGHTFLPTEHGFARLFLTLSGKSSNVAKLSFTIHKASNVFVAFVNSTNEYTVMHFDQYTKTQHWEVNVINEFMSKVHLIRITVQFKIPFTISNLRLPLRACFRNDSDISEVAWRRPGMFKYVREIH